MNAPSRIIQINDTSVVDGGAAKLALLLALELRRRGCAVSFFTGDHGENPLLADADIEVTALKGAPLLQDVRRNAVKGVYNGQAGRALRALVREHDTPDTIYHVHSWAQILSPAVFFALAPVASRTFITLHDFFVSCPTGNFFNYQRSEICPLTPLSPACIARHCDKRSYLHKLWRVLRQQAVNAGLEAKGADAFTFIAISEGSRRFAAQGGLPDARVLTIRNPVEQLVSARTPAETNADVLFIGRLQHEKGADLLAGAARRAGVRLVIAGAGPESERIRSINPDAVMLGWCNTPKLAAAMSKARLVVTPSRCVEPFSLAAMEALCSGVPVLLSQACVIGEKVEARGMGRLVDIYDEAGFASVLSELARDHASVELMSRVAWRDAADISNTTPAWVDAHLEAYSTALGPAAPQYGSAQAPSSRLPARRARSA